MIDESKADLCYYLAGVMITIKAMLASSSLITLGIGDTILAGIYLGLIVIKLLSQKYSIRDLLIFGVIGLLAIYTCRENNNYYLMFSFLGCIAIKGVNLRRALTYRCWTKAVIILLHVMYTFLMMIIDFNAIPTIIRKGQIRYDFFLGQPNTFQMYLLWTTLELLFIYFDHVNEKELLGVFILNYFFFLFTDSNTSIQVLFITCVLIAIVKRNKKKGIAFVNYIAKYGYGVISVLILGMAYFFGNSVGVFQLFLKAIDRLMTGRLAYGSYALYHGGLTFIGRHLDFGETVLWNDQWFDALYLDSGYLALLLKYGVVWIFIIGLGIYLCAKMNDVTMNIFLVAYILYGIMESYVLDASVCFPILFIGLLYFNKYNLNKNDGGEVIFYEKRQQD